MPSPISNPYPNLKPVHLIFSLSHMVTNKTLFTVCFMFIISIIDLLTLFDTRLCFMDVVCLPGHHRGSINLSPFGLVKEVIKKVPLDYFLQIFWANNGQLVSHLRAMEIKC